MECWNILIAQPRIFDRSAYHIEISLDSPPSKVKKREANRRSVNKLRIRDKHPNGANPPAAHRDPTAVGPYPLRTGYLTDLNTVSDPASRRAAEVARSAQGRARRLAEPQR